MWTPLLLSLGLTHLNATANACAESPVEILAARTPIKSVVLVAHGLNNHAHALQELYEPLRDLGATIVVLKLKGHLTDRTTGPVPADLLQDWKSVRAVEWTQNWKGAAEAAALLSRTEHVPLHFLGYSLGALVHTHALAFNIAPTVKFTNQVLLAPAIRIRARSHVLMALRPLGRGLILPSLSPAKIRSHDGTSIAAYESLFELADQVRKPPHPENLRIPTLILMNPDDELVSEGRLGTWINDQGLAHEWKTSALIRDETVDDDFPVHYLINQDGLGPEAFSRLINRLKLVLL